jgi:hypothetical protein
MRWSPDKNCQDFITYGADGLFRWIVLVRMMQAELLEQWIAFFGETER